MSDPALAPAPTAAQTRRSLARFLRYVWPYYGLLARATACGMLKFVLPSTMALALRFITDRLVPGALGAGSEPQDIVARSIDRYLTWLGGLLGPAWSSP